MPITRTPLTDDDGSGTTGTILNNAWQTGLYNAIDALAAPGLAAWTPYTPLWKATTTNPVLGDGTLTGRYVLNGKTVHFLLTLKAGATTTYGSGIWYFSLPVVAVPIGTVAGLHFAAAIVNAAGSASPPCQSYTFSMTEIFLQTAAGAPVNQGTPITFNANCTLAVRGTYETT